MTSCFQLYQGQSNSFNKSYIYSFIAGRQTLMLRPFLLKRLIFPFLLLICLTEQTSSLQKFEHGALILALLVWLQKIFLKEACAHSTLVWSLFLNRRTQLNVNRKGSVYANAKGGTLLPICPPFPHTPPFVKSCCSDCLDETATGW